MRVIAGTYKGRRIGAPKGRSARPTQDRVREALFNLLGPLDGLSVLDLYAGSGALGIEALSRGAESATFVDSDPLSVRAMRENLERLGIERGRARAGSAQGGGLRDAAPGRVVRAGVPTFLRRAARAGERWDLALCDPPYRLAHRIAPRLDELLPPVLAEEARVVCESSARESLELQLPLVSERRYGDTVIRVYERSGTTNDV